MNFIRRETKMRHRKSSTATTTSSSTAANSVVERKSNSSKRDRVLGLFKKRRWPFWIANNPWLQIKWIWRDFWYAVSQKCGGCLRCGSLIGVKMESSCTAYHWDGKGKDPNAPLPLCRPCAKWHHEFWQDRWGEYYSGLL